MHDLDDLLLRIVHQCHVDQGRLILFSISFNFSTKNYVAAEMLIFFPFTDSQANYYVLAVGS